MSFGCARGGICGLSRGHCLVGSRRCRSEAQSTGLSMRCEIPLVCSGSWTHEGKDLLRRSHGQVKAEPARFLGPCSFHEVIFPEEGWLAVTDTCPGGVSSPRFRNYLLLWPASHMSIDMTLSLPAQRSKHPQLLRSRDSVKNSLGVGGGAWTRRVQMQLEFQSPTIQSAEFSDPSPL